MGARLPPRAARRQRPRAGHRPGPGAARDDRAPQPRSERQAGDCRASSRSSASTAATSWSTPTSTASTARAAATGTRQQEDRRLPEQAWLDALLFDSSDIEAVVALGSLADSCVGDVQGHPGGQAANAEFVRITHPDPPRERVARRQQDAGRDQGVLLARLERRTCRSCTRSRTLTGRGRCASTGPVRAGDQVPIPDADLPAGVPDWWPSRTPGRTGPAPGRPSARRSRSRSRTEYLSSRTHPPSEG